MGEIIIKKIQEHKAIFSEEDAKDVVITPGSVSPLCLMFDANCAVKVLYDQSFEGQNVVIHPLRNTASISIKFDDLKRFTEHFGHKWTTGDVYKEE